MSYNRAINFEGAVYAVVAGKIWKYVPPLVGGKQIHEWICVHVIDEGQKDTYSLTATLGASQNSRRALVVVGADRDIWTYDGVTWHDAGGVKKCVCDLKTIMLAGCKCGGN